MIEVMRLAGDLIEVMCDVAVVRQDSAAYSHTFCAAAVQDTQLPANASSVVCFGAMTRSPAFIEVVCCMIYLCCTAIVMQYDR